MSIPTGGSVLLSLRTVAGALIAAPVFILIALAFVLGPTAAGPTPWLLIGIVVLLGLGCTLAMTAVGYRLAPLPAGLSGAEVGQRSRTAFTTALFRRFAIADTVVLVSVALAFIATAGGIIVVTVGVLIGTALAAYHVWPSERAIARSEQALEAGGVESGLREALGMAPRPPGFLA